MLNNPSLVIIPTYNESENIERLIGKLFDDNQTVDILIIDDNSPDKTTEIVKKMMTADKRIRLLERPKKMGLGTAYIAGFRYAIENNYDFVFEMDADFSHDSAELVNFQDALKECDLVLGSRYISGVNVVNWPLSRLILSYGAHLYTRLITGMPVKDATSGFKGFRREVLEAIDLDRVRSNGYSFQIEMTYKAYKKGFKVKELPIIFIDRTMGQSKMSGKIVKEAILMVWKLKIRSILGKL
ncbi:MAG: polyprenol monophosphomannose synthase [Calditrichaeota bacterium]|nr:polyprenol monophosphomannose synthase [Calditrichota bacterium]